MKEAGAPDIIVNECTPFWLADDFFAAMYGDDAYVNSAVYSPTDMGIPMNRPRKCTIVIPGEARAPVFPFSLRLLRQVAFRTLCLRGSVFLQDSKEEIKEFLDEMAARRKLVPRADGRPYPCRQILDPGSGQRLAAFVERATDLDVNADISQTVGFTNAMESLPTLVKNSQPYNLHLPQELFCAQGIPFYVSADGLRGLVPPQLLEVHTDLLKQAKKMAGNGMCVAQVGAALACALLNGLRP